MDIEPQKLPERENKKQGRVVIKNAKAIQIGGLSLEDGQCVFLGKAQDGTYGLAGTFGLDSVDEFGNVTIDMIALGGAGEFRLVGSIIPAVDAGSPGAGDYLGSASRGFGAIYSYAYYSSSDERRKKDIDPIPYGLEEIESLRPVTYKFKQGDNINRLGFIAQEVLQTLPEVVNGSEETSYGISYNDIIPVLVKSVQELSARVKELEAKVL